MKFNLITLESWMIPVFPSLLSTAACFLSFIAITLGELVQMSNFSMHWSHLVHPLYIVPAIHHKTYCRKENLKINLQQQWFTSRNFASDEVFILITQSVPLQNKSCGVRWVTLVLAHWDFARQKVAAGMVLTHQASSPEVSSVGQGQV